MRGVLLLLQIIGVHVRTGVDYRAARVGTVVSDTPDELHRWVDPAVRCARARGAARSASSTAARYMLLGDHAALVHEMGTKFKQGVVERTIPSRPCHTGMRFPEEVLPTCENQSLGLITASADWVSLALADERVLVTRGAKQRGLNRAAPNGLTMRSSFSRTAAVYSLHIDDGTTFCASACDGTCDGSVTAASDCSACHWSLTVGNWI